MVGFAAAFGLPVEDLLTPWGVVIDQALVSTFDRWTEANKRLGQATADQDAAMSELQTLLVNQGGEVSAALEHAMRAWIARTYPTATVDEALEYFALTFAGVPKDDKRWRAHHKKWPR